MRSSVFLLALFLAPTALAQQTEAAAEVLRVFLVQTDDEAERSCLPGWMTDSDGDFFSTGNDCLIYGGAGVLLAASCLAASGNGETIPGLCGTSPARSEIPDLGAEVEVVTHREAADVLLVVEPARRGVGLEHPPREPTIRAFDARTGRALPGHPLEADPLQEPDALL
ncbi:MAG: hypothetical protein AAGI52_11945 [Bacteroidota bacterium]